MKLHDFRAVGIGNFDRPVCTARINHENFSEITERIQAAGQIVSLVANGNNHADRDSQRRVVPDQCPLITGFGSYGRQVREDILPREALTCAWGHPEVSAFSQRADGSGVQWPDYLGRAIAGP